MSLETLHRTKHFIIKYFQKSLYMLFPLISKDKQKGLLNTYLFAKELDENILDYFLICEVEKGVDINEDLAKYLTATYNTEKGTDLCIFDISHISGEVDKFLMGEYSKYTDENKGRILKYYKYVKQKDVPLTVNEAKKNGKEVHFHVFLYPSEFKEEVAEEMFKEYNLFSSKKEALDILNEMDELCPSYDMDRETYHGEIIK